jgi:hypothetical protein
MVAQRTVPDHGQGSADAKTKVEEFVAGMTPDDKMLVTLRDELYGGRWDQMETDLNQRLAGRPYVFKLASRIEDDLARIRRMREVEESCQVNLKDYV